MHAAHRPLLVAVALAFALALAAGAGAGEAKQAPGIPVLPPSGNRGLRADYHCQTGLPGYSYNVCAKHIDPERPAGIYLYFPGEGARTENAWFGLWDASTLQPYHLIGINMAFADGQNGRDTAGKIEAARIAIGQCCADYKVVLGRGVIACFSGGGVPTGQWFAEHGPRRDAKGDPALAWRAFPFNQLALFSANYREGVSHGDPRLGWFISVGTLEWSLAALGQTQVNVAHDLARAGVVDTRLMIPAKEHVITDPEPAAVAEQFARTDVLIAPFLYEPDWSLPAAQRVARMANAQAIGAALDAVDKALAKKSLADDERTALADLRERVVARADDKAALIERLATSDPVLAAIDGKLVLGQLGKCEQGKRVGETLAALGKTNAAKAAAQAHEAFNGIFPTLFTASPTLTPEQKQTIDRIATLGPPSALASTMAAEYATLPIAGR